MVNQFSRINAEIDLDAVAHNFDLMHKKLKPGTKMCAVVKADCYGHGAVPVAQFIENRDYIWGFACATPEEAMELRNAGIRKPLIILGYAFPESYEDIVKNDIRACIFETKSAERLSETAGKLKKKAKIHLALDTGMSRIGFKDEDSSIEEIKKIAADKNLEIEGMFTHFARADEPSLDPARKQLARYEAFSEKLREAGVEIPIHHVSNSAALMRFPEANEDMVRAGITIYGLTPSDEVAQEMEGLIPVMSIKSHVSFVKTLPAGCAISYGGTYVTSKETRVATVPCGYADGYPRSLSNKGEVLIRGKRVPILGRVCMDQFMVDVSEVPGVTQGDEVVLLGRQGNEHISAEEIGAKSGRFNYEFVCDISKRVPRTYLRDGRVALQVDYFS